MSTPLAGRAFVKMHGLLNHFVIVDARQVPFEPAVVDIQRLCDVRAGVGADQLIIIEKAEHADAFMRILNVDGREVEACGNATRCIAWLLLEEAATDTVAIETIAGLLRCSRAGDLQVRCDMGRVSMDWQRIPLSEARDTLHLQLANGALVDPVAVNVGNPHAVFFVDDLDAIDMLALAPAIQTDALFPEQINVGVAQIVDDGHMRLVVYERGAGLTRACGTGACAAVYAAHARGLTSAGGMVVDLPGGRVRIDLRDEDKVVMTGPVAHVFSGVFAA